MSVIDRRNSTVSATDSPASTTPNAGLAIKTPVRVASVGANVDLQLFGLGVLDGVQLIAGDRVLLKDQTDATQNGPYSASTGVWQRTSDFSDNSLVVSHVQMMVAEGAINAGLIFHLTTVDPILIGTTQLRFDPPPSRFAPLTVYAPNLAGHEAKFAVAGANDQYVIGAVAGDAIVTTAGNLWLVADNLTAAKGLKIGAGGSALFSNTVVIGGAELGTVIVDGPGRHNGPVFAMRNLEQNPTLTDGAGGLFTFQSFNKAGMLFDAVDINGGLEISTTGSESGTLDIAVYRNGVSAGAFSINGNVGAIVSNAAWNVGDPSVKWANAYFSGTLNAAKGILTTAAASALDVRSGASGSFASSTWGRTSTELTAAVAGSVDQFVLGSVAGDAIIQATANLFLASNGIGSAKTIKLAASGVTTFPGNIVLPGSSSGTATLAAPATAAGTITLPTATATLATLALAETLANKTLTAPIINGAVTGTGAWNAAAITPQYGGLGADFSGTGGAHQVLKQSSVGTFSVGQLAVADLSDASTVATLSGAQSLTNKDLSGAGNTFPTFNQNTTGSAAKLTTARNIDGQAFDGTGNITVIAPGTHAAGSKSTPVDADEIPLVDSASSNVLAKLTWANLKATLKTYFDSLSTTLTNKTISGASNTLTNIGNGSLTNSSITIGSTAISLGGTATTIAGLTLTAPILGAATATTLKTADGSAASPALFGTTDTTSGVYFGSHLAALSGGGVAVLQASDALGLALPSGAALVSLASTILTGASNIGFALVTGGTGAGGIIQSSWSFGTGLNSNFAFAFQARGTKATPTAVQADDTLYSFGGFGYDGTAYGNSVSDASITFAAAQNFTTSAHGTYFDFSTTPNGTKTITRAMRVQQSGGISIGTTTDGGIGSVLANAAIKSQGATAGIGYATGAGGAVTQATSKSTGVTLNTVSGAITMNGAALAASTSVGFTLTNSAIAATDLVLCSIGSGASANSYAVTVEAVGSGSCRIQLRNVSGGSLSEAVVLNFAVIKGVTS